MVRHVNYQEKGAEFRFGGYWYIKLNSVVTEVSHFIYFAFFSEIFTSIHTIITPIQYWKT